MAKTVLIATANWIIHNKWICWLVIFLKFSNCESITWVHGGAKPLEVINLFKGRSLSVRFLSSRLCRAESTRLPFHLFIRTNLFQASHGKTSWTQCSHPQRTLATTARIGLTVQIKFLYKYLDFLFFSLCNNSELAKTSTSALQWHLKHENQRARPQNTSGISQ